MSYCGLVTEVLSYQETLISLHAYCCLNLIRFSYLSHILMSQLVVNGMLPKLLYKYLKTGTKTKEIVDLKKIVFSQKTRGKMRVCQNPHVSRRQTLNLFAYNFAHSDQLYTCTILSNLYLLLPNAFTSAPTDLAIAICRHVSSV